jgi:hypothetical protein
VLSNNNTLSKIYQENEKHKITFQGKKLDKVTKRALEDIEQFWAEQQKGI